MKRKSHLAGWRKGVRLRLQYCSAASKFCPGGWGEFDFDFDVSRQHQNFARERESSTSTSLSAGGVTEEVLQFCCFR